MLASQNQFLISIESSVFHYTWLLGQDFRYSNKDFFQFLYCRRFSTEIFSLMDIRVMFLKLLPFLKNVFLNYSIKFDRIQSLFFENPKHFFFKPIHFPVRILFATNNVAFSNIVQSAAVFCNMPFNNAFWLRGSLSGSIRKLNSSNSWDFSFSNNFYLLRSSFLSSFSHSRFSLSGYSFIPSFSLPDLLVVPDVRNNFIIWQEAAFVNVPILGLVNSNCSLHIDYPIPGNDSSPYCVSVFCDLVAGIIQRESALFHHKSLVGFNSLSKHSPRSLSSSVPHDRFLSFFRQLGWQRKHFRNFNSIFFFRFFQTYHVFSSFFRPSFFRSHSRKSSRFSVYHAYPY